MCSWQKQSQALIGMEEVTPDEGHDMMLEETLHREAACQSITALL